mmetsp:Transcript_22746/g.63954  ORF Transcript_22746/g.63954 Transcript_22746/m.63954 type:complete len:249 (+) Transcript_22746:167-913(+)
MSTTKVGRPYNEYEAGKENLEHGECETTVFVSESYPTVRRAFVHKVYTILLLQIAFTAGCVGVVRWALEGHLDTVNFGALRTVFWVSVVASFITLFALMPNSKNYPLNMGLLFLFTLCEGVMLSIGLLGVPVPLLLQSFLLTVSCFVGLSLYTVQEKVDFSFMRSFLFSSLWILVFGSLMQLFVPFPDFIQLGIAWFSALVFCGYIVYDTYLLHFKLRPDEYILCAVHLYLDFINLFLSILRILSKRK